MNGDLRYRVKDLLDPEFEHSLNGPNGFEERLRQAVMLVAREIDSIKDDLDWHGIVEQSHRGGGSA